MNPLQHLNMLLRFDRTFNLRHLIRQQISSGDRVLDAGCGLGILSAWAVQAGAASVDAVDLSHLGLALKLAETNRVADRICFHQANLLDFANEKSRKNSYDCIIAMIYLNDPRRDEAQSQLAMDLVSRLLKKDGKVIPEKVEYSMAVCEWPEQNWFSRQQRLADQVAEISGRYGLDFGPLRENLASQTCNDFFPERTPDGRLKMPGCRMLSREAAAFTVDYLTGEIAYPETVSATIEQAGNADAVIWWQKIVSQDHLIFTNQTVGWIRNSQPVAQGETVRMTLDGEWRARNLIGLERVTQLYDGRPRPSKECLMTTDEDVQRKSE